MASYWVPDLSNIKLFWSPVLLHFDICSMVPHVHDQQAYKCVSLSLWPHLTFFKLKISNIEIKRQGTGKEWVAMGTEFFTAGVFLLHYQPNKFQWSVLQVGQDSSIYILDIILGLLVCHHSSHLHIQT